MSSTSVPSRRRRVGGGRRAEVLDVVVAVLSERGYEHTRFTDVAKMAGVAVSTLQFYFGSRDDMLVEALHHSTEREVARLEQAGHQEPTPWLRLVALVDGGLAPMPIGTWRMLMEFWHAAVHDPELRSHSVSLQQRYRRPFAEAIRDGVEQGEFHVADDVEDVVTALIALLDGLVIPRVLDHDYFDAGRLRVVVLRQLRALLGVADP
ncbi:TetR/AcrR family transcriptional regulator [Nonomuraea sp. NPDC059023]|uniref:TetR/AcrR family transcriptional regulator n=1 Tax=unclassified Nonomuraea TaxID=2593643 RepID=UPI0036834677